MMTRYSFISRNNIINRFDNIWTFINKNDKIDLKSYNYEIVIRIIEIIMCSELTQVKHQLLTVLRNKSDISEFAHMALERLKYTDKRLVFYFLHSHIGQHIRQYFYDADFFTVSERILFVDSFTGHKNRMFCCDRCLSNYDYYCSLNCNDCRKEKSVFNNTPKCYEPMVY
jgi:hypothetical protein